MCLVCRRTNLFMSQNKSNGCEALKTGKCAAACVTEEGARKMVVNFSHRNGNMQRPTCAENYTGLTGQQSKQQQMNG